MTERSRESMEEASSHEITSPLIPGEDKKHGDFHGQSSSSQSTDEENSPVEQVALTVPTTDDPSLPVLTFRMWVLGTLSCVLLSFLNQFFWYRTEPLSITAISAQIAVVPLGQLMASKITNRVFFKGSRWEFNLNPGPFNVKEHVLITIFANSGAGTVYAIHIVTVVKVFYKRHITFFVSLLVILTTQVLGFGWAGIFRRYLVEPAAMWWPANLVQVSLFRHVHIFYHFTIQYLLHIKVVLNLSSHFFPPYFWVMNIPWIPVFFGWPSSLLLLTGWYLGLGGLEFRRGGRYLHSSSVVFISLHKSLSR